MSTMVGSPCVGAGVADAFEGAASIVVADKRENSNCEGEQID